MRSGVKGWLHECWPLLVLVGLWFGATVALGERAAQVGAGVSGRNGGLGAWLWGPLIHAGYSHLLANAVMGLVVGTAAFRTAGKRGALALWAAGAAAGEVVWALGGPQGVLVGASAGICAWLAWDVATTRRGAGPLGRRRERVLLGLVGLVLVVAPGGAGAVHAAGLGVGLVAAAVVALRSAKVATSGRRRP